MTKTNPTMTCLVQTFRDNSTEQTKQIKDSLKKTSGVNIISSEPVLGNFSLSLRLEGSLDDLFRAVYRLKSLPFIQHIATFLSPSEEIVPDKIGHNKVTKNAKSEIISYLMRSQGSIVQDIEDLRRQIDAILTQSQRSLSPGSTEIAAGHVREAISHIYGEQLFRRVDNLEERLRSLEFSFGVREGRRLQTNESQTFNLQRTQVSLKRRHIAILVMALLLSLVSLSLELYQTFLS